LWNQWTLIPGDYSPKSLLGAQKEQPQEGAVCAERADRTVPTSGKVSRCPLLSNL